MYRLKTLIILFLVAGCWFLVSGFWFLPTANCQLPTFLLTSVALAQEVAGEIEMADTMRESGKIYVVVAVLLAIFIGIVVYLVVIDRKVSRIEKSIKK